MVTTQKTIAVQTHNQYAQPQQMSMATALKNSVPIVPIIMVFMVSLLSLE